MKIADSNYYPLLMRNSKNSSIAQRIYDANNFFKYEIDEDDDTYTGDATFKYNGSLIETQLVIDKFTEAVSDYSCDCMYCNAESGCAHVGALYLKMQDIDDFDLPYYYNEDEIPVKSSLDRNYEALLDTVISKPKTPFVYLNQRSKSLIKQLKENVQAIEIEPSEKISLLPFLQFSRNAFTNTPRITMDLKIGSQKFYVVKDIQLLLKQIDDNSFVSYGRQFESRLNYDYFDADSQKIIDYLRLQLTAPSPYYFSPDKRYHYITSRNMSVFFNAFCNLTTSYDFSLMEDQMKLELIFEPQETGYIFYFNPESLTFDGEYVFISDEKNATITRYSFNNPQPLINFYDLVTTNHYDYVSVEDLNTFYHFAIEDLLDDIELIDFPSSLIMEDEIVKIEVYGDINLFSELELSIHLLKVDGTKSYGFSTETIVNKNLTTIQNFISSYATAINREEQKAILSLNDERTFHFLKFGLDKLREYCEIFISDAVKSIGTTKHYAINMGVHIEGNLLELDITSCDIPLNELADVLKNYKKKKKFHRLKNGELLYLESDELEELSHVFETNHFDSDKIQDGKLQLPLYRAFQTDDALSNIKNLSVSRSSTFETCIKKFQSSTHDFELNPAYQSILREYQTVGVEWMGLLHSYGFNGILADDMGLGKTIQVISLLDSIKSDKPSLVICPASLILNWEDEIHKFSSTLKCLAIHGIAEFRKLCIENIHGVDLCITSYDYIRRDIDYYKDIEFNYIILDEAQYIKNHNTKNAQTVKSLKATYRLALTGTPIENSLAELWSIFDFLMPNYLYNYNYFRRNFETPIVKAQNVEVQARLKRLVEPFILRRLKTEVLKELPDKIEQTIPIDLSEEEEKIYLAHALQVSTNIEHQLKSDHVDHIQILAMITKLRQLCIEPRLVFDNIYTPSSKMTACLDIISSFKENKKKILLFSSFTSVFTLLIPELKKEKIKFHLLTGETDKTTRRQLVQDFQTDDSTVFLISLKAGGTGLNLTAAEGVIHFDPWWNVSAQNQATDRSHRIGQQNVVQVYKLIAKNTIEEKIVRLQETKKNLADTFVEGNEGVLTSLSPEQLLELLK